jgi:hypothetical protein
MTITAAADPAPAQGEEDLSTPALRGRVLGNVPVASVRVDASNGDPDITTNTRPHAVIQAMGRVNTADLILHSQTLREMLASEHQYIKLLAAHVLSSSCANVQTLPRTRAQIPCDQFRHILRLFIKPGSPLRLAQWRCNCSTHTGPRHGEFVERVAEANGLDLSAGSFAEEPRRRWKRVTNRHHNMRDALCRELRRFPKVQATIEPRVGRIRKERRTNGGGTSRCTRTARRGSPARGGTSAPGRTPRRGWRRRRTRRPRA